MHDAGRLGNAPIQRGDVTETGIGAKRLRRALQRQLEDPIQ
jgi:hypothetical protein